MRSFKAFISVCLTVLMLFALGGCKSKEEGLIDAIEKNSTMKSYAFKMDLNMKLDSKELQDQQNQLGMDLSNFKYTFDGLTEQEKNKFAKSKMRMNFAFMGMNIDMEMLIDSVMTDDKTDFKMFIQVPEILKATTGDMFANYDYFYFGSETMEALQKKMAEVGQPMPEYDMNEMTKNAMNVQETFSDFIREYTKENKDVIEDKGKVDVELNDKTENLQNYEIKIDNEGLKKFLKAYMADEKRANELKSLLKGMFAANQMQGNAVDIDKITEDIDKMPDFIGEEGIVLNFYVKDGYVVKQDFNINVIMQEAGEVKYDLVMDIFDINGDIKVDIPNKEDIKSIDLIELIDMMGMGM